MKINIGKFKQIVDELFDFLEENEILEIELDHDLYWDIPNNEVKYNPEISSDVLMEEKGLGSLIDEWEFIKDI